MSAADWVTAGVALVGAGLAYLGARRGSRPEAGAVRQSGRDEWGRRFSEAITLMGDPSPVRRSMGRALVDALLDSDLAQDDDRRIARALLEAAALTGVPRIVAARSVDELTVVEDDEDSIDGGRRIDDGTGSAGQP